MDNYYKFNICIVVPCIYGNLNKEAIDYWIKYHEKIGINNFYVYCFDDDKTIIEYIKNHNKLKTPDNIIKYNNGDKYNCGQADAVKKGYELAKKNNHEFAIFIDMDEFIYIPKLYDNISEILIKYIDLDHISIGNINYSIKKGIPKHWNINETFPLERCWFRKKLPQSYMPQNYNEFKGYCPTYRGKRKIIINFINRKKNNSQDFIPSMPHNMNNTTIQNFANINELRINEYRCLNVYPTDKIGIETEDTNFDILDPFLNNYLNFN